VVLTNGLEGKFNFLLLFLFFFKLQFDSRVRECDGTEYLGWVNWFAEYKEGGSKPAFGGWCLWFVYLCSFLAGWLLGVE